MPEIAAVYLAQFEEEEETPILVADAALYSADNIRGLSDNKWVSRVPATISQAKELLAQSDVSQMIDVREEGDRLGRGAAGTCRRRALVAAVGQR